MEDKVPDCVGPLNRVRVRVERREERRIMASNEVTRGRVGPEVVGAKKERRERGQEQNAGREGK